jgi:hypothetical protein
VAIFVTMSSHVKYYFRYSIFLALIAAALYYWNYSQPVRNVHPDSWIIFGFFALLFFLLHLFLLNAEDKAPGVFVRRFMAVSTIRLFVLVIIMVLYSMTHAIFATLFIWHFLIFYFVFAIFEIAALYNHFKPKK